jgi:PAS domain-containing protein
VERTAQKSLPLILAREFASNLATPLVIMDADGTIVFFNEPAERIIGQTSAEFGSLPEREWRGRFHAERLDGTPVGNEELPHAVARRTKHPTHDTLVIEQLEGQRRTLSVTAIPLLGREDELVGVLAVFWEQPNE